jgi:membrane-associated phospholipid phosphatase
MATYMFYREQVFDDLLYAIMAVITLAVFLTFIVSRFWKISAHSIGMGGALGFMVLLHTWQPEHQTLYLVSGTILMSGAVLSARLALQAHTPLQVYSGFFLGLSLSAGIGTLI